MNPHGPRILTAVPRTLHTQLEIAKAIRTPVGPDDELLRQRRTEIAAIRRDLDVLARGVRELAEELPALVMAELQSEPKKYSPDQPRVPAGNLDGGQWTREDADVAAANLRVVADSARDSSPPSESTSATAPHAHESRDRAPDGP